MPRRNLQAQYARYEKEYAKRLAKTEKYGLKPTQSKYNLIQFETEVLTLRQQPIKTKDIALTIAKQQTIPLTQAQVQNLMQNAIQTDDDDNAQWSERMNELLDALGMQGKYDYLLNDKSHDRELKLTKMMTEIYEGLKDFLETEAGQGQTEWLSELIGEAFWGS